jgi:protein required for attachment to host cells
VQVRELAHDEGRTRERDARTDRAGTTHATGHAAGHALVGAQTAHEHDARTFARTIADALRVARTERAFDALVLVAEPRFGGILREAIDETTAKAIRSLVPKDLAAETAAGLGAHLGDVLAVG